MNLGVRGMPIARREYAKYDPFAPPFLPSPLNDEFDVPCINTTPPSWQNVGSQTATEVVATGYSGLFVRSPATTDLTSVMFERPLPPGPFTVATYVHNVRQSNWHPTGIYVRSSASNRRICWNIFQPDITQWEKRLQVEKFSALDTRDSVTTVAFWWMQFAFLRICYNGTSLFLQASPDGVHWTSAMTEAMTSHFTGGNLPDRFGMQMRSERVDDGGVAAWRFMRYFPTAFSDIGRIEVSEG